MVEGRNTNVAKESPCAQPLWSIPTLPRILELAKIGLDNPKALSTEDVRNLAKAIIYQYSTMGVK